MDPKQQQPGTALVRGDRVDLSTGEVVASPNAFSLSSYLAALTSPEAIAQQKALAEAYDRAVSALVGANDVQEDGGRTFKKKSAWRKLARFFQISVRIVSKRADEVPNDDAGRMELVAEVVTRATAPWGQTMEAVGVCSTFEKRFKGPGAYQKRHADCMATAQTRATNRCVSDLIAAGEISAEEMEGALGSDAAEGDAPNGAPRAPRAPAPTCPKCGGAMWDNRGRKRSDREPDLRCKDKGCLDDKGYVTAIFHYKPEGGPPSVYQPKSQAEVPNAGDGADPTASASANAAPPVAAPPTTTADRTTSGTTSSGIPSDTAATKRDEDRKVKGVALGAMTIDQLSTLIDECGYVTRYAELKATASRVRDRKIAALDEPERVSSTDEELPNAEDGDDLPF